MFKYNFLNVNQWKFHLNCLSVVVLLMNIHSIDSVVKLWIGRLNEIVIGVFLVAHSIKPLEDELEQSVQIFRAWAGHKYVRVTKAHGRCDGQAQSGRSEIQKSTVNLMKTK